MKIRSFTHVLAIGFAIMTAASAGARPSTFEMTCAQTQNLIQRRGAVPLNHGHSRRAGPLYDLYVRSPGLCDGGTQALPAWVPTTNVRQCRAGYNCRVPTGR